MRWFDGASREDKGSEMKRVYKLYHTYGRSDEAREENNKLIGNYSTEDKAKAAIERVRSKPGFRDHPEGFEIFDCPVDVDGWVDGYVHVIPGTMIEVPECDGE
jgi:hypothetical protein